MKKEKPLCRIYGDDENNHALKDRACRILESCGQRESAAELYERFNHAANYWNARDIIGEYVDLSDSTPDLDHYLDMTMELR